jgi:HEAT repeat protein/precorrin-3B methylase
MSSVLSFFQARLRAIVIVLVLILAVYSLVSYNRASQAKVEAALSGTDLPTRDAAVQNLVQNGRLMDVLINTQNPDQDKTSPQNVQSLTMRKNAADSVNRLMTEKKITPTQSFDTLFSLCKDSETAVKDLAKASLATLAGQSDANLQATVDRLSNGDPDIRGAAVDVLGKVGGDKAALAVNSVLALSAAQDSAVSALQKIGAPSVPLVIAHLEDPKMQDDIAFRQQMVGLLDQIADPSGLAELTKLAHKTDQPSVQRLAQVALADTVLAAYNGVQTAKDAHTKALDDLSKAKDDTAKATAQKAAADAVTASQKAAANLPLVGGAEVTLSGVLQDSNADSEARAQAALAIGRFASPSAIASLVTALGDFDTRVRDAALAGVQSSGSPAVGPLTAALGRTDTGAAAAQALGGIGTPAAVAALKPILDNPATPVAERQGAAIGLGRSANPGVIPALVRALGDSDGGVASAAQEGLLTPALAQKAIPALIASFTQPAPAPFHASETLARMGALTKSDVVPALAKALAGGGASSQTWAAVTLGQTGSSDAPILAALRGLAQSPDPHIQYAAQQSLIALSGA